jgi:hypothetical protein
MAKHAERRVKIAFSYDAFETSRHDLSGQQRSIPAMIRISTLTISGQHMQILSNDS